MRVMGKWSGPFGPGYVLAGNERFSFCFHVKRVGNRLMNCSAPEVSRTARLEPLSLTLASLLRPSSHPLPSPVSQFIAAVRGAAASLPAGQYRNITVDFIAACIAFLKASFTFNFIGTDDEARTVDTVTYGKWDTSIYNSTYINDIKEWLLNEDECPTEWDVLLTLREQHAA